jgi:uncharacterized glyoxalase superfamily protein PhnB
MTETNGAFPVVPYADPRAAIAWLERCLDATTLMVHPPEGDLVEHAEILVGTGIVMIADLRRTDSPFVMPGPVSVYVVVDDPDALHARATAAGAELVRDLQDQPYGSREFSVRDPGGNVWSLGTYRPGSTA